jgi:hypothetical protein
MASGREHASKLRLDLLHPRPEPATLLRDVRPVAPIDVPTLLLRGIADRFQTC